MRNLLLLIALTISVSTLSAQESYSFKLRSIVSVYDNILGEAVEADVDYQLRGWIKNTNDGDYLVYIKFLDDLDPQQHTRKRGKRSRYHYEVQYLTPTYAAKIIDRNGHILLNKTYGAETVITPFGKDYDISSIYQLQDEWTKQREKFYQAEEAKHNHVNEFLSDLANLLGQGLLPPVMQEEALTNVDVSTDNTNTNKERVIENSTSNNITSVPNTTSVNDLRTASNNSTATERVVNAPEYKLEAIRRDAPNSAPAPATDSEVELPTNTKVENVPAEDKIAELIDAAENESFDNDEELEEITEDIAVTETEVETVVETDATELESERIVAPIVIEQTKPETALEKRRRLQKEKRAREEWERIEEEDVQNASSKSIRPRYVRLGLRAGAPILIGLHAEGVLPILNNQISIVGDFSSFSFGTIFELFLDDGESLDDINAKYQHYSIGANYYFGKRLARGWYVGASYMKSAFKTDASFAGETVKGEVALEAATARIGINLGRKLFMFGIEAGLGVPFNGVEGTVFYKENGATQSERVNQNIPIIPMFNLTLGIAL